MLKGTYPQAAFHPWLISYFPKPTRPSTKKFDIISVLMSPWYLDSVNFKISLDFVYSTVPFDFILPQSADGESNEIVSDKKKTDTA